MKIKMIFQGKLKKSDLKLGDIVKITDRKDPSHKCRGIIMAFSHESVVVQYGYISKKAKGTVNPLQYDLFRPEYLKKVKTLCPVNKYWD